MNTLSSAQKQQLEQILGEWVRFDKEERRIYSHDVGPIPKLIKPLVGKATAAAVVQPESEDQLVELVKWANDQRVPSCRVQRRLRAMAGCFQSRVV